MVLDPHAFQQKLQFFGIKPDPMTVGAIVKLNPFVLNIYHIVLADGAYHGVYT
jgi:hypothetical protein